MENEKESGVEGVVENGKPFSALEEIAPRNGELAHELVSAESIEEADEEQPVADYAKLSKPEMVVLVQELLLSTNFKKIDTVLREVKPFYDEIFEKEKAGALERFRAADGVADGFEYKGDAADHSFEETLKLLRDRRNQFYKSLEEQKSGNLFRKQEVLDKLRVLVDGEDSENSFHQFKQLQQEWKAIGPVAQSQVKTLWANYSALVDRFYDNRSIYFELKELDRKKNLLAKLELCEKAERLLNTERVKDAVRELNELHSEFKHIGPVPKEDQEPLWQRFKAASDGLYARRDAYISGLQETLQKNLADKLALAEELAVFATFQTDRIKEWNQKTQEILQVQKKWEAIGAVPRARQKEINKKFWSAFKSFFSSKGVFFKKLDEERDKNLQLKNEIIGKAKALQESSDWDKTANELKELQRQWKEVGPVPEKLREKIFAEFKQACDHFFEHRRAKYDQADREQEENLKEKEAICAALEQLATEKAGSLGQLKEFQTKFNALGFVPKRAVNAIRARFNQAVENFVASSQITAEEKDKAMLEVEMGNLRNDPNADRKIYQREQTLRKQITKAENDIAVLRNNLEFFGRSKNAEKFKEEFNAKIAEANEQLQQLKSQLKVLRTVS